MKTVWLSCEGETPADVENMGPIQYLPRPGFPGYYFPYNNTENYLSPIVPVRFEKPRSKSLHFVFSTIANLHITHQFEVETSFVSKYNRRLQLSLV
jgi:hypothetical protein